MQLNDAKPHGLADELCTDSTNYLKRFLPLHASQRD
jgi:hypothetical protein